MQLRDLRYTLRLLAKKPGFAALTTMVIASGIGLSAFLFSFLNTAVFKDLPFTDGGEIIKINGSEGGAKIGARLNASDYYEIRTNLKGVQEFGSFYSDNVNVAGRDGVRRYSATYTEPNIFTLTRTKPILGRGFTDNDNKKSAEPTVVIGYDMWANRFGGSQSIIGEKLRINGESHLVVGVMPDGYSFPGSAELWIPMQQDAGFVDRSEAYQIYGMARLDGTASLEAVNLSLATIMQRISQRYPDTNTGLSAYAASFQLSSIGDGIAIIYSMQTIAFLILVLASVNAANLMLARAIERSKETAIRVALGAPRNRLIGQLLLESVVISLIAGCIAFAILSWGLDITSRTVATFSLDKPPYWWNFGVDAYTLSILVSFIVFTVLATGLAPAIKNVNGDFNAVLRDGTRGAESKKTGRLNKLLVIGEIFVSFAMLIPAAIISFATYKATIADYGADTENKLTGQIVLTGTKYETPESRAQFFQTLEANLNNEQEIGSTMIASALPGNYSARASFAIENREYDARGTNSYPKENYVQVSVGTLEKLGVSLVSGRYFNNGDKGLGKGNVLVTSSFADRHFKNESAVGKRIRLIEDDSYTWLTIVGVVEHTIHGSPTDNRAKQGAFYRPISQDPSQSIRLAFSMNADKKRVEESVKKVLLSIDPDLPIFGIQTYAEAIDRNVAALKLACGIFLVFSFVAVILSSSGIYGVMANTVNAKSLEIGVKRAIGASDERVMKELIMLGVKQLLWGGITGLIVGGAMGFGISQVFGVDILVLAVIAVCLSIVIGAVVMASTYIPAQKALATEPSDMLRDE